MSESVISILTTTFRFVDERGKMLETLLAISESNTFDGSFWPVPSVQLDIMIPVIVNLSR